MYPDVIFIVEGIGEEFPDIWKAWTKNGKMYKAYAQIKFPEFSEALLQL